MLPRIILHRAPPRFINPHRRFSSPARRWLRDAPPASLASSSPAGAPWRRARAKPAASLATPSSTVVAPRAAPRRPSRIVGVLLSGRRALAPCPREADRDPGHPEQHGGGVLRVAAHQYTERRGRAAGPRPPNCDGKCLCFGFTFILFSNQIFSSTPSVKNRGGEG